MITVPESVLQYAQQPDVKLAVDLLIDGDDATTITKLRWPDVALYYRAWLAAHQTCAEHALFLEELWTAIWSNLPAPWRERLPGDPIRDDMAIDPNSVFEYHSFGRTFETEGYVLELATALARDGRVQIGIGLWDDDENSLLDEAMLTNWEQEDKEESDYFHTQPVIMPLERQVDPEAFSSWVETAWSAIRAAIN